jgi:hypothetical protein
MYSSLAQKITVDLDVLLSLAVFAVFLRPSLRKKYPWMFSYMCLRAVTAVVVWMLMYGPLLADVMTYTKIFFVVHWASYLISAGLLFMSCLDVYKQALAPLQGLVRMGTTIFRWAAVASILVTATTFTSVTTGLGVVIQLGILLMRCVGTTELCLLALLLLSMKAIDLSPRSRPFGMAIGLGIMAALGCAESSVAVMQIAMTPQVQCLLEGGAVLTMAIWAIYSSLPEPERKTVTVRADSTIYKWDLIARALDPNKGINVALPPTHSTFLVDVEKTVDRIFVKALKGKESES